MASAPDTFVDRQIAAGRLFGHPPPDPRWTRLALIAVALFVIAISLALYPSAVL